MTHTPVFFFVCMLMMFCGLSACQSQGVVYPGRDWQHSSPQDVGLNPAKVDEAMQELKAITGKLGNSRALVIYKGRIVWAGADAAAIAPVWSCTKSFTSTCLGLAWDDGKLSPQTRLADISPEYQKYYPDVTLEQLATFTSGYEHSAKNDPFTPTRPMYAPGAAIHYSLQTDVLAQAITRAGHESLHDLFMRRIGSIIGIDESQFIWKNYGTKDGLVINGGAGMPDSSLHMSAYQMARFGWLYACYGNWDGKQLISRRYIDYATNPRVLNTVPPHEPQGWYTVLPGCYGLNWWVNGIDHNGKRKWPSAPAHTFAAQGNNNNICLIIPEWQMVLVRIGGDKIIDVDQYDRVLAKLHEAIQSK